MKLQINEKKYERQCIGQQRWKNAKELGLGKQAGWGVWWYETGTGKTFAAIDMARKMVEHNSSFTFIIIVPGPRIQDQWQNLIREVISVENQSNFQVLTIDKVIKYGKSGLVHETTLLILDEIHEYYSDERIKIFFQEYIKCRWCLGLTANYEDVSGKYKLIQLIMPVVDRIDTEEAVREGYISKYIEYNLGIYLTSTEKQQYDELSNKITKNLSKFGRTGLEACNKIMAGLPSKDYNIVYQIATSNGWRNNLNKLNPNEKAIDDLWAPSKIIGYAVTSLNSIRERKNLIYNATNKLKVAVEIVVKFDTIKTICFSETTNYADTLCRQINDYYNKINQNISQVCVVYHSNLKTIVTEDQITGKQKKKGKITLKKEAINMIIDNKARVLSTTRALDKGLNIPDIKLSLTTSGTQNPIQYNQRKGRAVRKEENKEDMALIINLYARNTIDEKWLKNRQSKGTNVIYYVDSVDDINYTPINKETFNIEEV